MVFSLTLRYVTLGTRTVVGARDFTEQPNHTRRSTTERKWRTATAHRTHGTSRFRADQLTPSFSTDIITCTRTVLTIDDPPLVTFFPLHDIRLSRFSYIPSLFTSLPFVWPRCLTIVVTADRSLSHTLLPDDLRFSWRIASATKHTHDIR